MSRKNIKIPHRSIDASLNAMFYQMIEKEYHKLKYLSNTRLTVPIFKTTAIRIMNESKIENIININITTTGRFYRKCTQCKKKIIFNQKILIDDWKRIDEEFGYVYGKAGKFYKKIIPLLLYGCCSQICYKIKKLKE